MWTILNTPFLWLIKFYQVVLSPGLPSACRFLPTCSQYAYECFQRKNPILAFLLTAKRLLRCHPWGGSGYDPSPK